MRQKVSHLKEEALQRYKTGESSLTIAKSMGIGRHNIHRWVREAGIVRDRAVPEQIKTEIIRMYTDKKMLPREIAINLSITKDSVIWVLKQAGVRRTKSEGMSISVMKRRKHSKGGYWQSSKTGQWEPAASIMEMLRMQQLDDDPTVASWTKTVPFILYGDNRTYVPDIYVEYTDGRIEIEEIKPVSQHEYPENQAKWDAAKKYTASNNMTFRVISEIDLGGSKALREYDPSGLQQIDAEAKSAREKLRYDQWRERNKDKIARQKRERYQHNREQILKYTSDYNDKNRERINARQREYNRTKRTNHSTNKP
ncbi:MAG: Tn7 transposase TnsA N-terminal domain-containing protein [Desulfobacter sp.]